MSNTLANHKEIEKRAHFWVDSCYNEIKKWDGYKDFFMNKVQLDWSTSRKSSRGGWYPGGPGINIAMHLNYWPHNNIFRYYEYPAYDSHKVIGGFYAYGSDIKLGATICHEMAHAAQMYPVFMFKSPRVKPHGDEFKTIYAKLRTKFINPLLPCQKTAIKEYMEIYRGKYGL